MILNIGEQKMIRKKRKKTEIFKLFIEVSSSGYKFFYTPSITDFYYDDEEKNTYI